MFGKLGITSEGVLGFFGVVVAGLFAWFGRRGSTVAQQQTALNDAFHTFTDQLQEERATLTAHGLKLEGELAQARLTLLERDGEIRSLRQLNESLQRMLGHREEMGDGI